LNCAAIAGRATVIEEPVKGTRNEARHATRRMTFFSCSSTMSISGFVLVRIKGIEPEVRRDILWGYYTVIFLSSARIF
jgi:hypothetical protein